MFDYILFDLDGTLTDPKEGICKSVQYALKKAGIDEPDIDKLEGFIGPPLIDSFMEFYHMDEEEAKLAVVSYRERFSSIGLYENELYDGMDDMLRGLKEAGKKLAVASSKPELFVKKILKHFKLNKFFDVVVGSELDGRRSDKSEVVNEALRQLFDLDEEMDVKAFLANNKDIKNKTAMVGDRKFDIIAAKNYGIASIGVKFGYAAFGELEKAGADYIASDVESLGKYLIEGPKNRKNKKNGDWSESKSSFFKSINVIVPLIWYYFVMMCVTFVGLVITNGINKSGDYDRIIWLQNNSTVISGIINLLGLIITSLVLFFLFRRTDEVKCRYKNDIFIFLLSGGFFAVSLNVIVAKLSTIISIDALKYEASSLQTSMPFVLGLFIYAIFSPFAEELVFRWLIYGRMKKMLNVRVSVFISAMFFGFYHRNLLQGIYAFIMGVILALVYEWSKSIWASFAFHFGANAFVYSLSKVDENIMKNVTGIPATVLFFIMGIILLVIGYLRKDLWQEKN